MSRSGRASNKPALPGKRTRRWRVAAGGLLAALALLFGLDRALPPDVSRAGDTSILVTGHDGTLLRGFTTEGGIWRLPATAEDVSPLYLRMLVAYEDQRFESHPGVDPLALARAVGQVFSEGEVVSGASTLTMQAARLLEPRERTVGAKIVEMARALQLEARYSKDEILGFYLTLAPYGGTLEGVRAASWAWFGKEPRHLTPGEAALLVVLPQAPSALRPDRYPERARRARDRALTLMAERGVLTPQQAQEAMQEAVPTRRRPMPFTAPHLARHLAEEPGSRRVLHTTLDAALQRQAETLARVAAQDLSPEATVAILVVENETRAVRVYVGSSDFFDFRRQGQVDMVRAIRSPGSTLKPFIYGFAIDDRLIHPETVVLDRPTRFTGGYTPENFERSYLGEVSVRRALQHSLNVPAVAVLEGVGPTRFAARVRATGARLHLTGGEEAGLPIALGGVGITLEDLVLLYTGLANGGEVRPLRYSTDAPDGAEARSVRMISARAAWHLARILEDAPLPGDVVNARRTRHGQEGHRIAFKTGTSYGFRDAWAVGYDSRYTVGVWVGRPDGTPSPGRYGRLTAAPIVFRIFGMLPPGAERPMPGRPDGVLTVGANGELPRNLQRFGRAAEIAERSLTEARRRPLAITYPPDGSIVELEPQRDGRVLLPLTAQGGARPLRWLVNGRPVAGQRFTRTAFWRPDSNGFVRVTVIDADGESATSVARVR